MASELDLADLGLPANLKLEIEGKLKELDVYIDEELPDYILVLLANKKSQIQMCKDLRLFFGSLTDTFVQWVHTRVKDLRAEEEAKQKENSNVRGDSCDNSSSEIKSKRNRKSSSHSEKSDSTNQNSKVTSPKDKKPDSSVRDSNSFSLRKRKSRSPDPTKKSKPRIQQEGEHLTSTRSSSADKQSTQQTNLIQNNTELNKTSDNNDANTKNTTNKRKSPSPTDRGHQSHFTAVTPPPSPAKEPRVREKIRGRERQGSAEGDRKEERYRSRSNPTSPSMSRRPPEDQQRRSKNQPRLRYFNTRTKSPSPPGLQHHAARKFHQLSSVVKIKSNRDVRSGRNISIQDEQKGSIRLVHKALTEAAASTARSFPRNSSSPKKRRGVMERLGPQVDNSPRLRPVRLAQQKKRKSVILDKSVSDSSFHSQQRLSVSDTEADLSRSIDPIKAQFDVIQLSHTESTCYISDDDLFPPREDSPKRKILSNRAGSDPDSMFDSEEVLPLDDAKRNKRRVMPIKQLNKPKFIVTLDGAQQYRQVMSANSTDMRANIGKLDVKQRLGFKPNESSEELTPIYTPPEMSPLSETLKTTIIKPKLIASTPKPIEPVTERCKFFPNCKLGEKCDFHHPSLPCKNFPYCKFNQKCYYLHPDCKFDPYCTKPDCAFLHRHARTNSSFQNHFKNTYSFTADSKSAFPARSQLTWTPGQKIVKEKIEETGRHISERKFALEEVQTVIIPKTES